MLLWTLTAVSPAPAPLGGFPGTELLGRVVVVCGTRGSRGAVCHSDGTIYTPAIVGSQFRHIPPRVTFLLGLCLSVCFFGF